MILYCGYSLPCGYSDDVVGSWCIEKYCRKCSIRQMIWWSIDKHVFRWIKNTHQFWHAWTHNGCLFFDLKPLVMTIFVHAQYVFFLRWYMCTVITFFFMYDYMLYTCRYLHYVVISPHMYNYLYCHTYIYIYIILYYIYARGFSGTPWHGIMGQEKRESQWQIHQSQVESSPTGASASCPHSAGLGWSYDIHCYPIWGWYPLLSYDILWF